MASQGPSSQKYSDFTLKTCTPEDVEQTRYHVLKFHSKNKVDPLDESSFTRPLRLHRKDPKNLQFQLSLKEVEEKKRELRAAELAQQQRKDEHKGGDDRHTRDSDAMEIDEIPGTVAPDPETEEDKKERLLEEKRQKLQAKREAELAHIAPDGGARKKRNFFKRKTRQIHAIDDEKRRLRYEEFYPWVLEDYEGKQNWVGSYEAGNSDTYVLFVFDKDGFKLVPAEKVYKFTPRNKYATLTLEEAEAKMKDNAQTPRWLMSKMEQEALSTNKNDARFRRARGLRTVAGAADHDTKDSDNDDLDFDEEFADDEEAPIVDGNDEENKESEKRMKREMLRAANMVKQEDDDDLDDLFETKKVDKEGQKLRKALAKNALNEVYESDDDEENPYISESEAESDVEIKKEPSPQVKSEPDVSMSRQTSPPPAPGIYVKSYGNGTVVLSAKREMLAEFPAGEWNPNAKKRSVEPNDEPNKKIKLEEVEDLTEEEVAAIVGDGPIELNALLRAIGPKVHEPKNKDRLRIILKSHYKLKNKQVTKRV